MNTPELVDEPELTRALILLVTPLDQPLARQIIDITRAAFDAGYASCLVRKFTPGDQARANLAAAMACLPKPINRETP